MILNESSRDNLLLPYVELLKSKGKEVTVSQLKQFLLAKFVNEAYIRNLSLESNYYLAGVARYYFEGKLTENKRLNVFYSRFKDVFNREICQKLNALILILRNSYIDTIGERFEQPEDFGTLPLEKLLRKYGSAIKKEIANDPEEVQKKEDNINRNNRVGNGYTFEILYSYNDAKKYQMPTNPGAWCITYGEHHYSYYKNNLNIHYVIFAKDGYENIPRKKTEGWTEEKPHDAYGNSLIALLQSNKSWEPIYITSRWNHGVYDDGTHCEADHAYTTQEFMDITGVSKEDLVRIFEIWKTDKPEEDTKEAEPINKKEVLRKFKYAQMKLNGGNFENLFGTDECKIVKLMSNVKNIEDISQQIMQGGGNPEAVAALTKRKDKMIKNCVTLNSVTLFGHTYYFLRDGNKILFETIFNDTQTYRTMSSHYATSDKTEGSYFENQVAHKNNLISIAKPSSDGNFAYYLLYDFRKHAFVEIEGVRKFKKIGEVSSWDGDKLGYYEIANGMQQRALVDIRTNNPLVLPNGRSWVEQIDWTRGTTHTYSREIRPTFYGEKKGILKLIVDTSSDEAYCFDMHTKTFFEPPIPEGNDPSSTKHNIYIPREWDTAPYCTIIYVGYSNRACMLYYNGKPVEIDGNVFFNYIKYTGGGYVYIFRTSRNEEQFIFDVSKNIKTTIPDNITDSLSVRNSNFADERKVIFEYGSYKQHLNLIYDEKFNCFIKNPMTDNCTFNVYGLTGENHSEIEIYKDNDINNNVVYIVTLKEESPEIEFLRDEEGNLRTVKQRVFESIGSLYSINRNDINKMVYEIIRNI